ncbi:nitroreductase/quinone reductase family protein [Gordonia sp. CPCC 206044]
MNGFQKTAAIFNKGVTPLLRLPGIGSALSGSMTVLHYTGRKSGKQFELPVGYRRKGDEVIVGVAMPDRKTWWRNFSGDGAPISVDLDGGTRTGHAVSNRNERGEVSVRITLDA